MTIEAVLFDLDGTLVHSAPRIAASLNLALADHGIAAIEPAMVATMIGGGVPLLLERALTYRGVPSRPSLTAGLLDRYRETYLAPGGTPVLPFPGVEQALAELRRGGLKLGVVTNTLDRFMRMLLQRTGLAHLFDTVVSADTLPQRKPDPAPLLHACSALAVAPDRTLFVGDSRNDAEAAQAAGMRMICMTYGYNEGNPVRALVCAAFLDDMGALPARMRGWCDHGTVGGR
jgi:phosphoglycolate phosphatase